MTRRALRRAGVTRLSLGAQSMSDAGLRRLGRRHRAADVGDAVDAARAAGIDSISLDLLYDVPDASLADWMDTLETALALEPDHLSLYALTLDDPDAEGLTGPGGDHLPTTAGARRWRDDRPTRPGRGPCRRPVPPCRPSSRRRRLARLRDQQLGTPGPRESPQPRLLGAPAVRGRRSGRARLRRRDATMERGPPRWLPGRPHASGRDRPDPAARRGRAHRPEPPPPPRPSSSACAPTVASRWPRPMSRRWPMPSAGRWPPSCSMSRPTSASS